MTKTCTDCLQRFEIPKVDLEFLRKVSPTFQGKLAEIPPPTMCPPCRRRRRMTWRNERNLHRRTCDFSGKQIISIYRPESPHTVYDVKEWNSDKWDALEYGRAFDPKQTFFEQFQSLHLQVPLLSLNLQAENINCDFTNLVTRNKDCYLIFAANDNENCYYCNYMHRSRDTVDCFFVMDCERCYECVDCQKCMNAVHCSYCEDCSDSSYLDHCRGCHHCFGCSGLIKKSYHLFNEPLEPEEYERRVQEIFKNPEYLSKAIHMAEELSIGIPHKYTEGIQNEDCTGDHLVRCRRVLDSYDCTDDEDCRYCTWLHEAKDCADCYAWGLTGELGYENHLCGNDFYGVQFSESCWNSVRNLLYCRYCVGCSDCFGCVGLQRKQYCVLNAQYSREEYEALAMKVIAHMHRTQEWGEFFPTTLSPFPYNDTLAQDYEPLSQEDIEARGWKYGETDSTSGRETITWEKISSSIAEVPDSITEEILACERCGRNFRIIPQELRFYRSMGLPIPRRCFDCRCIRRMKLRNPRRLWNRSCAKCQSPIATTYAPDRPEIVYCESCYLQLMY